MGGPEELIVLLTWYNSALKKEVYFFCLDGPIKSRISAQAKLFVKFFSGEDNILAASYGKYVKQVSKSTHLLPFFGTDYGLCSLIKPQITFNASLEDLSFNELMKNYSSKILPGMSSLIKQVLPLFGNDIARQLFLCFTPFFRQISQF